MLIFARPGPFRYDRECQHLHKQPAVQQVALGHSPSFAGFGWNGYNVRICRVHLFGRFGFAG